MREKAWQIFVVVQVNGSCLKTGQHFIFLIIYLLLPIKCIIFDSVSKILFNFLLTIIIMILIMNILLHNVYEIINLWYPTYVYQFFYFPYNYKNRVLACFQTRPKLICVLFSVLIVSSNKECDAVLLHTHTHTVPHGIAHFCRSAACCWHHALCVPKINYNLLPFFF